MHEGTSDVEETVRQAQTLSDIGRQKAATELLERALMAAPDDPRVVVALAVARLRAGQAKPALELGRRALAVSPAHQVAHRIVVTALLELRHADEAVASARTAVGVAPSPDAQCDLALAEVAAGDPGAARASAEAAAARVTVARPSS